MSKIAFIHIPKTAGTSFTAALRRGWPRNKVISQTRQLDALGEEALAGIDLLSGHFYARQLEDPRFAAFDRVTVLRDPFERLFSTWRFACKNADRPLTPDQRFATRVGFGEYAFSLPGARSRHTQLYILGLRDGDAAEYIPLADLLAQARQRLEGMLAGTVETLGDLVTLIFQRHGKLPPPLPRLMVTPRIPPEEAGLTRTQHAALEEMLEPDYALYRYARELLEQRLEGLARAA